MRNALFGALALGLIMGAAARLEASVIPIDNFDHGDPALPGWFLVDLSAEQPWGPGEYDPSSGALRIYHSGDELVPPGESFATTAMFAIWNASFVDPVYSDGYLQMTMRSNEAQNGTGLYIRGDLASFSSYMLFGRTQSPGYMPELDGHFQLSKWVNGAETPIWESDIEYLPGEDWNVELGAVGARITAKVWKVGDPEPSAPQFDWVDEDPLTSGIIGISSDKSGGNTDYARGDATFDDIVFCVVPEPAASVLLLAGLVSALPLRRKR